jgi:SAM-dependent methyltransferase
VAAYDGVAAEYDDNSHATTRALERLSLEAYRRARPLERVADASPTVLELGAGTGVLTSLLVSEPSRGKLIVTDPASGMLAAVERVVEGQENVEVRQANAETALSAYDRSVDVVAAGLADPFLTAGFLRASLPHFQRNGLLFLTVPSHRWALAERNERLDIPIESTRFRLASGAELMAASWTYDQSGLTNLVNGCGFAYIDGGTCTGKHSDGGPVPEVAWVLARPRISQV